jgi:hypothetical protein
MFLGGETKCGFDGCPGRFGIESYFEDTRSPLSAFNLATVCPLFEEEGWFFR